MLLKIEFLSGIRWKCFPCQMISICFPKLCGSIRFPEKEYLRGAEIPISEKYVTWLKSEIMGRESILKNTLPG